MASDVCWAPECSRAIVQVPKTRPRKYCSSTCRQRAFRRNGGSAPAVPYPPLVADSGPILEPRPVATPASRRTVAPAKGSPQEPVGLPQGPATAPAPTHSGAGTTDLPPADPSPAAPDVATGTLAAGGPTELTVTIPVDNVLPPVPLVTHPMVAAYERDLDELHQRETTAGQKILAMAHKLVSGAASPSAAANLSKELDRLMDELSVKTGGRTDADPFSIIRERTLRKLGVVGVSVRLP